MARYRDMKYGMTMQERDVNVYMKNGTVMKFQRMTVKPMDCNGDAWCRECGRRQGIKHTFGCSLEICPIDKKQFATCEHGHYLKQHKI